MLRSDYLVVVIAFVFVNLELVTSCPCPKSNRAHEMERFTKNYVSLTALGAQALLATRAGPARASQDIKEIISQSASYIPGLGQPNVYYPLEWIGYWSVSRNITEIQSAGPSLSIVPKLSLFKSLNKSIDYEEHFIVRDGKVILDRSYSLTSFYRSLYGDDSILTIWDVVNPNIITITNGGSVVSNRIRSYNLGTLNIFFNFLKNLNIRLTKRALENIDDSTPSTATRPKETLCGYSEFGLITEDYSEPASRRSIQEGPGGGSRGLLANGKPLTFSRAFGIRTLVRERLVSKGLIKGVDRTYIYPANTLDLSTNPSALSGGAGAPIAVIKGKYFRRLLI